MSNNPPDPTARRRLIRRWIVTALVAVVVILALGEALDPYDDRDYMSVPHGDHTHYVPRDRDQEAPISNFPVVYPSPSERILPDGRVVPVTP